MPIKWDQNNDIKLFGAVIEAFNLKFGAAQMGEMAKFIGGDCTAKAVEGRVWTLRGKAKKLREAEGDAEADEEPKPKRAKTTKGGGRKKKAAAAKEPSPAGSEDDEEEAKGAPISPKSAGGKKRKREQQDGIEVGEDIGEGLRAGGREVKAEEDEEWV